MHGNVVADELKSEISKGKYCIVFDVSVYFPYVNQEKLRFSFSLGEEKAESFKLNHRYPNKGYVTLSKKYGRKVSKIGYPYFIDPQETENGEFLAIFHLIVDIDDGETIGYVVPLQVNFEKDKSVCGLTIRLMLSKDKLGELTFESYYPVRDGGWRSTYWSNFPNTEEVVPLGDAVCLNDDVIYSHLVTPHTCKMEELLVN